MTRRFFLKWLSSLFLSASGIVSVIKWFVGKQTVEENQLTYRSRVQRVTPQTADGAGKLLFAAYLLSDPHISEFDLSTSDKFRGALNDISTAGNKVDAIILGGDLTDYGREKEYNRLKNLLNEFKLPPLFANMGNHDYYDIWINSKGSFARDTLPNGKTDAQSRARFMKFMNYSTPYHDVWINGVHLILLSQETYLQENREVGEGAWYSDKQLTWLRQKMSEHANDEPAIIIIHQPMPGENSEGGTHSVIRANELRDILEPYSNVFIFSGHTHQEINLDSTYIRQRNLNCFHNSAVCRVLTPNGVSNHSQGMYIEVYENELRVRGREFTTKSWVTGADWKLPINRHQR
ncbi:metallophosphoesterase family protein [Paenibacillus senegalensis]|uniref:metallophosphoesterase family protein n=1 Tax=Paenibacillus senegalensis TaxID=1465766 RepID=UPI00028945F2|nr:metallophosphoesterase [Paenibacillus senegalensis]